MQELNIPRWQAWIERAGIRRILAMIGALALLAWTADVTLEMVTARREARRLDQELEQVLPREESIASSVKRRTELVKFAAELRGWQTSRVTFASGITAATKSLPSQLELRRLTLQQTFANGARENGLAYYPRYRSHRLTIGGAARGSRIKTAVDQYRSMLSAEERFGTIFGPLALTGQDKATLDRDRDVVYEFLIEGRSAPRRIDPAGSTP